MIFYYLFGGCNLDKNFVARNKGTVCVNRIKISATYVNLSVVDRRPSGNIGPVMQLKNGC